jgi:hypothetical protein
MRVRKDGQPDKRYLPHDYGPRRDAQYIRGAITRTWSMLEYNAEVRGLKVEITRSEYESMIFADRCFHCGCSRFHFGNKLKHPGGKRPERFSLIYFGIDRRDSGKDYTSENCVPCCVFCQNAKMAKPEVVYHEWLKEIRRVH